MDVRQAKIEKWITLIQSVKLQDVLDDIQMSIRVQIDGKLNKNIFKLLLHLCRTTDECAKSYETGKKIAELTKLLCSLLIDVPDDNNFVKCLFKIVRCLISLHLYEDAAEVCCYLKPGELYNPQSDTMELLTKVLSLWHVAVNNVYLAIAAESLNEENYSNLKAVITHELRMTQIAHRNYTKPLIVTMSAHFDKIATIDREASKFIKDLSRHMQEYLTRTQLCLEQDEKYIVYCHVLRIVCNVMCKSVDISDTESTRKTLDELSAAFENLLADDEECYQCFQQFRSLCATLLVPVENFVDDSAKAIQSIISCNLRIAQRYECAGALMWNAVSTAELVEPLFIHLEKRIEADKCVLGKLLDTGVLPETMNLFVHMDTDVFYTKTVSIKCKWCLGKVCTVKRDLYNAIVMKCRCLSLICRSSGKTLAGELCVLARQILEQNVRSIIREMRECKCKRWMQLWNTCRTLIYNVGILFEHIVEESTRLFALLCRCIFQLQAIHSSSEHFESPNDLENSVSFALHKQSVLYYNNGIYRKAMTACALNALLTYDQPSTKAFQMWASIKKCAAEQVTKLTIMECLRNDKDTIKDEMDFLIDTSKYDLTKLYLREVRSLLEEKVSFANCVSALLEEFQTLEPSKYLYAHVAQLLGHYLLKSGYDGAVLKYYKRAVSDLKQDMLDSTGVLCLEANLQFFTFVEELHAMNEQTQTEMEHTKFALYAPKLPELSETKSPNIVPAYTMINVKKDSTLVTRLQKCLKKWSKLFKCDISEIVKNWEPNLILDTLITAGEYCRLYRYEDCETEIWKMAYKLGSEMDDYRRIIYVTGRCISLRQINHDWIAIANKYAIKHKDSKDDNVIHSIAIFWISLADFYFECGKHDDAKQLLTEARNLSGISFVANISVYLLSLDTIIRYSNLYKEGMQYQDYGSYIVESLFAMRSLHQDLLNNKWKSQMEYLFSHDVLFTTTINLSTRINSLLSFRGISADLVRRLKMAQSLGAVMRTAELLKSLCYIDLSRSQLDDCEVKLQGLEHILDIETFELSMKSKSVHASSTHLAVTPTKIVDPIRDMPQQDSSPVLGKKLFDLPKFTSHSNCHCHKCRNVSYQYLVFATVYIRAQLYASQHHVALAFDHFHGALEIWQRLFGEKKPTLSDKRSRGEVDVKQSSSSQDRFYIVDYVQLLIDFCYFLKMSGSPGQQNAFNIANLAIDVCREHKLEGHPVYVSAKEIAFDNNFQIILTSSGCSGFVIPQPYDIDVSDYVAVPIIQSVCVTPIVQKHAKKPLSVRRRRSPVALKITKVNMIWSDDEDDDK